MIKSVIKLHTPINLGEIMKSILREEWIENI